MSTPDLSERLRSKDFVTRTAAEAELGRGLVAVQQVRDPASGASLGDILFRRADHADILRAFVDVKQADVAGLTPKGRLPWGTPSVRPFWTLAQPLDPPRVSYEVPKLHDHTLVALQNPLEKIELTNLPTKIDVATVNGVLAVWAADVAVQVMERAQPTFEEALTGIVGQAIYSGLEDALIDNLVVGVTTTTTDPVVAVAHALVAWGPPVVVLAAEDTWAACAKALGPIGMIDALVPVAGNHSMAVSVGNLGLLSTGFQRITASDPMKLGLDLAVFVEAVAWVNDPSAAALITAA